MNKRIVLGLLAAIAAQSLLGYLFSLSPISTILQMASVSFLGAVIGSFVANYVPRHLEMLLLIAANGDDVRIVKQDIRGHQHGIGEKSEIRRDAFGSLVFVAVRALEQAHRRQRSNEPIQFADFREITLTPKNGFFRVESAGEPVERDVLREAAARGRVGHGRQRMIVRDKIETLAAILQLDGRAHRAKVVANVQRARRRDTGENAHGKVV